LYIDVGDEFMHPCNADVYMKYKLLVKDDTEYNNNDEVRVVEKMFCHLWSQILIDKCDTNIDRIDYSGVTSTALGNFLLSNSQACKYTKCLDGKQKVETLKMQKVQWKYCLN
jgi:hypothetical protein